MRRLSFILLLFLFRNLSFAQESLASFISSESRYIPTEKTIFYQLAGKDIPLKVQQYGNRADLIFINLHDDEFTSVKAAKLFLESEGGLLIEVENELERIISFRHQGIKYSFDPNRIFSREGIAKSLSEFGRTSSKAMEEVEKFGQRILQLIPDESVCVISLHNNTPELFSAMNYTPGNERAKEAKKVFINPTQDADDFFLTTDRRLYENLANKGYNTILQDNRNCTEDGSLSVYCGKRNIRYVNCETEHGKTDLYFEMLKTLHSVLPKRNL